MVEQIQKPTLFIISWTKQKIFLGEQNQNIDNLLKQCNKLKHESSQHDSEKKTETKEDLGTKIKLKSEITQQASHIKNDCLSKSGSKTSKKVSKTFGGTKINEDNQISQKDFE